jgi:hypothetical protein
MKITNRCGAIAVDRLIDALLAERIEANVLKTNQMRANTVDHIVFTHNLVKIGARIEWPPIGVVRVGKPDM